MFMNRMHSVKTLAKIKFEIKMNVFLYYPSKLLYWFLHYWFCLLFVEFFVCLFWLLLFSRQSFSV